VTPQTAAEPQQKNALARVIGVFTSPKETFADIGARPTWLVPLIIVLVFQFAFMVLVGQHIGWRTIVAQGMEKSSQIQSMPAEQKEQAIDQAAKFGAIFGYVGVAIGVPVVMALMAGVLLGSTNMFGGRFNFKQSFAIVTHASLIGVITSILSAIVMFAKPAEDFDMQNPLAFNLGAFLPVEGTAKWLMALAGSFDLFTFWSIGLLATGYAAASGKLKFSKALTAVVLPWAVYVVVKVGWAAFRG
jgi:Yip1 domain